MVGWAFALKENPVKKSIPFALLVATLAAGSAFAQANSERLNPSQPGIVHPEQGGPAYGNSGWTIEQDLYNGGRPIVQSPDRRRLQDRQAWERRAWERQASAYPRTRSDRDGDGVRNSRDRYPDDPRYR